jgi:hypothetical protein
MKKLILFIFAIVIMATSLLAAWYECPDDGCSLVYTGKDDYCVGINCRHIAYYRCGCCNKIWKIYVD